MSAPESGGRERQEELLRRLGAAAGLCGQCSHRELVASARSVFLRCGLARDDASFPRYPPLPVLACAGFSKTA